MAATTHTIHVGELAHHITLKVKGLAGWKLRLLIARMLFIAGAWIAGVNIVIENGPADVQD